MNPDLPNVPFDAAEVPPASARGQIERPRPGIWASLGWCLSLLIVMVVAMIAGAAIDLIVQHGNENGILDRIQIEAELNQKTGQLGPLLSRAMGFGFIAAGVVSLFYTLLIVRVRVGSDWTRKLAIRTPRFDHLLLALVGLPALMILHGGAHHLANLLFRVDPNEADMTPMLLAIVKPWPRWLTILVIGLAPGIGEELWCRGFLGRGLIGRYGWFAGVLFTSLFFGMLHLSPPYALGTAFMGACLHFTYLTTRSLWIPILLHAMNNSLTMLLALGEIPIGKNNPDDIGSPMLYLVSGFLAFAVGFALFKTLGRLVDATGNPVVTPFPTLALPPAGSGNRIVHGKHSFWTIGLVLLGVGLFVVAMYLEL